MANICEKLIEQVSSDSAKLSPELQSHVLTCPECQQYLESIKGLKAARKGMSAKEAAAIAGIVGLIGKEAAASAAAANASSGGAAGLLGKAVLVVVVVAALTMVAFDKSSEKAPLPAKKGINIQTEDSTSQMGSAASEKQSENSFTSTDELTAAKEADNASPTADSSRWQNSAEQDKIDATNSIIVSPDQEDIKSR